MDLELTSVSNPRVKELAERYETPLPQMASRVAELEAKVNCHMERMGFSMNGNGKWRMGNQEIL